jgi:hypothetical protein
MQGPGTGDFAKIDVIIDLRGGAMVGYQVSKVWTILVGQEWAKKRSKGAQPSLIPRNFDPLSLASHFES